MKLTKLMELHSQLQTKDGLENNFGDGYLMQNNHIFRNVRIAAQKNGFAFSDEDNNLYQALPFSQLERILSDKVIPYVNNVTALRQILNRLPESVVWDDLSDGLKKNYAFHEACHCVARSLAKTYLKESSSSEGILQILLEESFANTCELLGVIDVNDQVHRIFYELNSYTSLTQEKTNFKTAVSEIGEEVVFKFMMMAYLQSNFLGKNLDEKNFDKALKIVRPSKDFTPKQTKTLKALSRVAFTLDLKFRTSTTGFHLQLNGFKLHLNDLLSFEFFDLILKHPEYIKFINALTESALKS